IRRDDQRLDEGNRVLNIVGGLMLALFGYGLGASAADLLFGLANCWACGLGGAIAVIGPVILIQRNAPKWQRPFLWAGGFLGFILPVVGWKMLGGLVTRLFGDLDLSRIGILALLPSMALGIWLAVRFIRRWEAEPQL